MKVIMEVGGAATRTYAADYLWMAIPFFAAPMILDWQVGAWVTLVACVSSVIQIVMVMSGLEGVPVLDLDLGQ